MLLQGLLTFTRCVRNTRRVTPLPSRAAFAFAPVALLMAFAPARSDGRQTIEIDLAYGSDPSQRLNLSIPAALHYPTVVFVHGGSLT